MFSLNIQYSNDVENFFYDKNSGKITRVTITHINNLKCIIDDHFNLRDAIIDWVLDNIELE